MNSVLALLAQNPFFWLFFVALFCGISLNILIGRAKSNGDNGGHLKWIKFCVFLSIALCFLMAGLVWSEKAKIIDINLLYFFMIVLIYWFLAFRFKLLFGLPTLILFFIAAIFIILFLQALNSFSGETEIGKVRVLSQTTEKMVLEITAVDQESVIVPLEGDYFTPVVEVIIFDDFYVFLGYRTWYRFLGVHSFVKQKGIPKQTGTGYYYDFPSGISEQLFVFLEENENWIPGIKTVQTSMELKHVNAGPQGGPLYSLLLQNDGSVQIVDISQ